jgi:hypothetical protein
MDAEKAPGAGTLSPESKSIIENYLAQCRAAVSECFDHGRAGDIESTVIASRLIRTSLAMIAMLEGLPNSIHKSIVEQVARPDGERRGVDSENSS